MMMDGLPTDLPEQFNSMITLLDKIERWWIVNVEVPLVFELADKEIEYEGIIPGRIASLKIMTDIALGSDEEAEYYINEFNKKRPVAPNP